MLVLSVVEKMLIVSGETTVPVELLAENEEFMKLIRDETVSQEQAIEFVNENY